jgi:predicted ATPase
LTTSAAGHAQFLVATHSPILLSCPDATIYSFDRAPIVPIPYEQTDHYKIFRDFMQDRYGYLSGDWSPPFLFAVEDWR